MNTPVTSTEAMSTFGEIKMNGSTAIKEKGFRWRGGFGVFFLVPTGAAILLSPPLIREGIWADLTVDLLAWGAFVAGLTFRLWPTLYVGGRKTSTLVTQGPYSVCRNPLYVGSLLLWISIGLFLKSVTFAAALGAVILCYIWATVPIEEGKLRARHGQAYDAYCRQFPRFWPRFRLFHTSECVEVRIKGLRIEYKRLLGWIWLPFVGELVAHLRVELWWPKLFHLF